MSVDRSRLPDVLPDPALRFPRIARHTLANGLELRAVSHRSVPLVSASLMIRGGSAADPADRPGLTALTTDLLDEGAGGLDALGIADAVARLGGDLDIDVNHDSIVVTITMLRRFLAEGLELLAAMATAPTLAPADFDRVRALRLERLRQLRDHPPAVAEQAFARFLYGAHPYGHLGIGTEDSLRALDLEEARALYRRHFIPAHATLVLAGDADDETFLSAAGAAFGGWAFAGQASSQEPGMVPAPPDPAARLALVPRPGAAQSELRIGHVVGPRDTPDYHALLVLNMVLGGQFVSRINLNLRERRGYTYGAHTRFDLRRGPGPFVLQTSVQTEVTADAVRESIAELSDVRGARPVTDDELAMAHASLTRGYARGFETLQQVARAVAQLALHRLPDTYFEEFVPRVQAVSREEVMRVAERYLNPSRLSTVIVGDVDRIGPSLEALALGAAEVLA